MHNCFKDDSQIYLKAVGADGQIAGFANWQSGRIKTWKEMNPPFVEGMNAEKCEAFFAGMDANRQSVMGEKEHYCTQRRSIYTSIALLLTISTVLSMVATSPSAKRKGVGSTLVKWGCDRADQDGLPAYLDSSAAGKGLYEKFGFVCQSDVDHSTPMVRPAKR